MSTIRHRARVFKSGDTWHVQVRDQKGRLIAADNTGAWRPMYDHGRNLVAALDLVASTALRPIWDRGWKR